MVSSQDKLLSRIARLPPLLAFLVVFPLTFFGSVLADFASRAAMLDGPLRVAILAGTLNVAIMVIYLGYPLFLSLFLSGRFASRTQQRPRLALAALATPACFGFGMPFFDQELVDAANAGSTPAGLSFAALVLLCFAALFYLQVAGARALNEAERGPSRPGFRTVTTWFQLFYLPFCIYFLQRRVRALLARYEHCGPGVIALPMETLKIAQLASGHIALELTERAGWDDFEAYAKELLRRLDARALDKTRTVDKVLWDIEVETVPLRLVYEGFPNRFILQSNSYPGDIFLRKLHSRLGDSA